MFCQTCGTQNAPEAKFCESCGAPVAAAAAPSAPTPVAPPPPPVPAPQPAPAVYAPVYQPVAQAPQPPVYATPPTAPQFGGPAQPFQPPAYAPAAAPRAKGGGGKWVGLVLLLIVGAAAGGAWWYWRGQLPVAPGQPGQAPQTAAAGLQAYAGDWVLVSGQNVESTTEASRRVKLWVDGNRIRGIAGNNEGDFDMTLGQNGGLAGTIVSPDKSDTAQVAMSLSPDGRQLTLTLSHPSGESVTAVAERYTGATSAPPSAPPPVTTTPSNDLSSIPGIESIPPQVAEGLLRPDLVSGSGSAPSGTDSSGSTISYTPDNVVDGMRDTAWRVPGNGVGHYVTLQFNQPVTVTGVSILPGYAKVDPYDGTDRFYENRRVRRVRLEFSDGGSLEASLADSPNAQPIRVPQVRTTFVRVVVLDSSPSAPRDFTAMSEVEVIGSR